MWIMTTRGMYSAVEKYEDRDEGMLTIRSRVKQDLLNLKDLLPNAVPYREKRYTDYPWRIRVLHEDWDFAVATMSSEIDYSNFKDRVKVVQGAKRASVYGRVWAVLLSLEPPRRYKRGKKGKRKAGVSRWDENGYYGDGYWNDYGIERSDDDVLAHVSLPIDEASEEAEIARLDEWLKARPAREAS